MSTGRMRQYALTYIIPGSLTQHQADEVKVKVEALAKKYGVVIDRQDPWGKKSFAYVITHAGKKQREGYYYHLVLTADAAIAQKFEQDVSLLPENMRHLMVIYQPTTASAPAASAQE